MLCAMVTLKQEHAIASDLLPQEVDAYISQTPAPPPPSILGT